MVIKRIRAVPINDMTRGYGGLCDKSPSMPSDYPRRKGQKFKQCGEKRNRPTERLGGALLSLQIRGKEMSWNFLKNKPRFLYCGRVLASCTPAVILNTASTFAPGSVPSVAVPEKGLLLKRW